MNNSFDPSNAVAVNQTSQGSTPTDTGSFNVDNAVPVDTNNEGHSAWDSFNKKDTKDPSLDTSADPNDTKTSTMPQDGQKPQDSIKGSGSGVPVKSPQLNAQNKPLNANSEDTVSRETVKPHKTVQGPSVAPHEDLLNGFVHSAEGAAWNLIGKPVLGMNDPDVDRYLEDVEKQHPIAATIAGTAPYIATAPLFPAGLIGVSAQFASVSGLSAIGKARTEDALKPMGGKILDVAEETVKGASFGPIWHYSAPLGWVGRAFARGAGTTLLGVGWGGAEKNARRGSFNLSDYFGDNIAQAFKQGGIITALSLIFENPALAMTSLGRGIIAKSNKNVYEAMFGGDIATKIAQTSKPTEINPQDPPEKIRKNILDNVNVLAPQVKDKSQIASATIKLPDGTEIHGTSHEDALNKIGSTKAESDIEGNADKTINLVNKQQKDLNNLKEGTDYKAGFTVLNTDGSSKFITREEAKQDPYNLPTGHSSEVKGLNESKFMSPAEEPKVANPETLKSIADNEGKMDIHLIPGVAEITEAFDKASKEYVETLKPGEASEASNFTSSDLRERLGKQAQLFDRLEATLSDTSKMFDKATPESITETYTKAEKGEKQDSPELQKAYDTLQYILANQRERVRALGKGKLEHFINNYLPHIWDDPKKANMISRFFIRSPFEGGKSFLKKRSIESFADGIEAGLTPVSWNPVTLTMLKVREMERYILAHSALNANKAAGFAKFVRVMTKPPEGWQKINDNISTVMKSPMIAIQEAYDEHVMNQLNNVAKSLGIDVERLVKLRGGKAWGQSQRGLDDWPEEGDLVKGQAQPGRIKTKFAGPTSVLAHEIGHQIDEMYSGKYRFIPEFSNMILDQKIKSLEKNEAMTDDERKDAIKNLKFSKKRNDELKALADLRYEGKADVPESFKKYVRKGSEKMAVMLEAYIHAPNKFKEAAPELFKRFDEFIQSKPELKPLSKIEPSLVLGTNTSEVYAGGMVTAGHYYAHPDSARIFNNYLSPGLTGKSFVYDTYRQAGNTLNQFQLGISAFHLGFTSMDATVSKFALGINKLSNKNFAGAMKEFATAPFAPVTNILAGRKLLQSWYGKDNGILTNTIADLMASAGGRAKMDKFYATGAMDSMNKALKEGKIVTAAFKVPFYIVEQIARPIMEYIVPRQKMGVFMDMMKMEMERKPGMSHKQMRGIAQRAWNSVDNRMGQLVYDNLFWNRMVKDLSMASVRSLGWNLGTVREIGGGVKDVFGNVNDVIHGKATQMSYRTAYVMALPIVTGLYGAIYQYLHTGQGPQELKDYFFPKNGGVDNKGQPARISLPTYMKDIYHYTTNPVQTVINKFSPVNNAVMEMLANKDFYGVEIRNTDDPAMQQLADESSFIASQFLPFGFRNQGRDTRTSAGSKIEPFIGITPAPYDINMTAAEKEAYELEKGKIPVGSRTKEQAQHSQDKAKLRSDFMASKDRSAIDQAVDQGIISSKESKQMIKEAGMSNLQRMTQHLTFEEVVHVMKKASPDEKAELQKILDKKRAGKEQRGTWTDAEDKLYDKTFKSNE